MADNYDENKEQLGDVAKYREILLARGEDYDSENPILEQKPAVKPNYDPSASKIEGLSRLQIAALLASTGPYDPNASLIGEMISIVDGYEEETELMDNTHLSFEVLEAMFSQYDNLWERIGSEEERKQLLDAMRQENKLELLPSDDDLLRSAGNAIGSLSLSSFGIDDIAGTIAGLATDPFGTLGDAASAGISSTIDASIRELQALLSRAVGPIEEIPSKMLVDDIRRVSVAGDTQTQLEHELLAKLHQLRGNKLGAGKPWLGTSITDAINKFSDAANILKNPLGALTSSVLDEHEAQTKKALTNPGGYPGMKTPENIALGPVRLPLPSIPTFGGGPLGALGNLGGFNGVGNRYLPKKFGNEYEVPKLDIDGFTFRIENMATGKQMDFPGYIENLNESDNSTWNSISLINRSEDIYVYEKAERGFNLEMILFAEVLNNGELTRLANAGAGLLGMEKLGSDLPGQLEIEGKTPIRSKMRHGDFEFALMTKKEMWDRVTFLHQCQRPRYVEGKYQAAPYIRLWLGSLFRGIYGIIDTLNFSYEPLIWDFNDKEVKPMMIKVSMNGKLLHGAALGADDDVFYDFDIGGDEAPIPNQPFGYTGPII